MWPSGASTTTASVDCSRTERAKRSAAAICSARRWIERSVSRTSVALVSPIEIGRDQTATGMALLVIAQQARLRRGLGHQRRRLAFEQRNEVAADQTGGRIAGQFAEPVVDIEDDAIRTRGQRAVAHALDQHAIGLFGAVQQNDLRAFQAPHHHDSIDVALMDGGNGFVGVFKQRQLADRLGTWRRPLSSAGCRGRPAPSRYWTGRR